MQVTPTNESKYPTDIQAIGVILADSTTTALGASATFTGATINRNTEGHSRLKGAYISDQSGTLKIQFSLDGTTWKDLVTLAAGVSGVFDVPFYWTYARAVYTNGATLQGNFTLAVSTFAL